MDTRRETKRQVIALRTMLRSQALNPEQRRAMEANIVVLRQKLDTVESQINASEISARRTFLQKNKGLFDIFNTFWVTLMSYTMDGFLSKEGYSKFHHAVEIALAGEATFASVDEQVMNADWTYDRLLYGNLNKVAFFDMLFELIETWTEIVDPTYYAAFAWALLDSIADTTAQPPKLRPLREMRCITKMENESSMLKAYVNKKKVRAALSIESEMMERIPDVQKRLHARRHGRNLDDAQQTMVEALSLQAADSIEFADDDTQSLHTATSLQLELELQAKNWQGDETREEDDDSDEEEFEDSDCELPNGEEILQNNLRASGDAGDLGEGIMPHLSGSGSPTTGRKRFSVGNSQYALGRPTASFLSYCSKRRSTRVLLNGVYGVGSLEGSGTRSLSTGSGVIDMTSMVILPSVMSSQYSGSRSGSECSYSVDGDQNPLGSQYSLNNSQHNLARAQGGRSQGTGVLLIASPTRPLQQYGSNPQLTPFGGNVGDKARFSQFIASGKRLGSFAKGFLATHDVNSGLNTDAFTSGNKHVINAINSHRSHAEALKMTKTPTLQPGAHGHSHPHLHSQSVGQLATLVEESLSSNNNNTQGLTDLSLLGKSMYVPHTSSTSNNSSSYTLIKPAPKQALQGQLTSKGLNSRSAATLAPIKTDLPEGMDGPGTTESEAFTDNLTDNGDAPGESTGRTPGRAPRSHRAAEASTLTSSARQRKLAPVAVKTPSSVRHKANAVPEEGAEYGEAVDDDITGSQFFNVLETQLSGLSTFRPELTSELLSQNSAHQSFSEHVASLKNNQSIKNKNPKSGKFNPAPVITVPVLKAADQGNRGCFLLVESQAPPVEKVKTIFRPASRGNLVTSRPTSPSGQNAPLSQFLEVKSRPASEQFAFAHSSSEILPPEISTSSVINLLSPAPNDASFAALLGLPEQQKSPPKSVSLINFPFGGPSKSVASGSEGGRARSNSNVSYADSDVSYEPFAQMMKASEPVHPRHPRVGKHKHLSAHSRSMERPYLDTKSNSSAPRSIVGRPGTNNKRISPLLVLDASSVGNSRQPSRAANSANSAQSHLPKRGTNMAIVQPHHLPMKPEYATFPQGMYYNVVKHALNLRQQPNLSPSWDHNRASKAIRLSTLNRPVDASLSLTTAAMNVTNANKLAEVIRHTEHHQKILGEKVMQPCTAPKRPPLTINITSAENEMLNYGSALENADISKQFGSAESVTSVSPDGYHRESQLHRGSFEVPSAAKINATMLSGNAIPAPDALLESLVLLRGHTPAMSDEILEEAGSLGGSLGGSLSGSLGPGASQAGYSQASSPSKNGTVVPSLLIKPCTSAVNLQALQQSQGVKVEKSDSPSPKGAYFNPQGKLQVKDVNFHKKDLFEIHHDIQVLHNTGKSTAQQTHESQQIPTHITPLVPIKHPYLTMNGTKHVLPDRLMSSIVSVRKSSSLYEPEQSQAESVFLGNSSGVLFRDSTMGHTSDYPAQGIPWLPRGTLEPLEHDRSNHVLGKREALDLQRSAYGETNKQVLTIRSQKAIREAFEQYVQKHTAQQHSQALAAIEFHQLERAQQEALLQQMQSPLVVEPPLPAPLKVAKVTKKMNVTKAAKKQKAAVVMSDTFTE